MTNLTLSRLDLAPFSKFTIGCEDFFNEILRMHESNSNASNYPPYNIIRYDTNEYSIEIAVAGFDYSEIDVSVENNMLTVSGDKSTDRKEIEYLYRGISARSFKRTFTLGDYVVVKDAVVKNGMLNIKLERIVPDALKPRKIAITSGD